MLLNQITTADTPTGENQALRAIVAEAMGIGAPVLSYLQFRSISGNSFTDKKDHLVNGAGEMRAVNNDYTKTTTSTPEVTAALRILGDKIRTDQSFVRRFPGQSVADERARQLRKFSVGLGRFFQDQLINADGTGDTITGIKALATGSQLISLGANGANTTLGNSDTAKKRQQEFISAIDELLANVPGAQFLIMDVKTRARLKAIAREQVTVSIVQDAFGGNQELSMYNGLPIVLSGFASDNTTKVIGHSEVVGSSGAVCTSIYAVASAEDADLAMVTSTGLSVKDLGLVGQHYETNCEFDVNTLLYRDTAVGRLQGIIID